MNRMNIWEIAYDLCEQQEIKTSNQLDLISQDLHQAIEEAMTDYAADNNIEDYVPYI